MTTWKTVAQDTDVNGVGVLMKYAEFGKGRGKVRKWELFRGDEQGGYEKVGYAVNEADAKVNFARVKDGATLNANTGFYEYPVGP